MNIHVFMHEFFNAVDAFSLFPSVSFHSFNFKYYQVRMFLSQVFRAFSSSASHATMGDFPHGGMACRTPCWSQ